MPPARSRKRDDFYRDRRRRKVCAFCADKTVSIDYKEVNRLRRYLSERAKIEPRRKTGTCAAHQRSLNVALKRARQLALLPFTAEHIRVTGVLVREPGAPPFRGSRPRPQDVDGVPETPVDGTVAAEPTPDGQAAEATSPAQAAPPTVVAETPAAESPTEAPVPVTQAQEA